MMAMAELAFLFFLSFFCPFTSGSSKDLLVREVGSSVQMHIKETALKFYDLSWMFNKDNIILFSNKQNVQKFGECKDRMEFSKETYMLTLKDLNKTDSGLYEAKVSGEVDTIVAKYTLSVIDAVEKPDLTYQPNKTTCNISVTCKGHTFSISSCCTKENCEKKEETSGDITLSIYNMGSSVICKQSNPVNWKTAELDKEIFNRSGEKNAASDPFPRLPWLVLSAVIIITQSVLNII